MRNLVFVFAALAIAPACTTVETGLITVNWEFHEIDDTDAEAPPTILPCPTGFDIAEIHLTSLTPGGTDYVDAYSCSAMTGTEEYEPDIYDVELLITNGAGQVYAVSPSEGLPAIELDITNTDKTVSVSIADNGGYFGYAWNLVDAGTQAPLTCAQAGADSVEVVGTLIAGGGFSLGDRYPCEDGAAVTAAFPAGSYTMSADALDANNAPLTNAAITRTATMGDRNDFVNLGTVVFNIQ